METIKLPKHIHLYRRINLTPAWKIKKWPDKFQPYEVLSCIKPTCTHRLPISEALGKLNECNICHEPFILDKQQLIKAVKPRCNKCIVHKKVIDLDSIDLFLKDI